jgi:hypothetical protein
MGKFGPFSEPNPSPVWDRLSALKRGDVLGAQWLPVNGSEGRLLWLKAMHG